MDDLVNLKKLKRKQYPKDVGGENYHKKYYQESDDSEDERILSKIGRLQQHKYKDKDFIGYDENLQKIKKKEQFSDKIEQFIQRSENKDWWRIIRDELNNQDVVLTDKQLHFLDRLRSGKQAVSFANNDYYFEYDDFDAFNLLQANVPKRRFQPSKNERIKVNKLVQGIKLGRIRLHSPPKVIDQIYDVWEQDKNQEEENQYLPPRISAPKQALPTTVLSYNPPKNLLFTKEQKEAWLEQDPEDREPEPQQYRYLRHVPQSAQLTQDLFNRCLDLYLCPRVRRKKLMMKSSDFLPQIQSPEQFKPYPTHLNHDFGQIQDSGPIVNISVFKNQLAVCYKQCVAIFDIKTTKPLRIIRCNEDEEYFGCDYNRYLAVLKSGMIELYEGEIIKQNENIPIIPSEIQWQLNEDVEEKDKLFSLVCKINLGDLDPHFVHFHSKGDYFVTTQPTTQKKSMSILVHCISKGNSSQPFQKMKGSTEVQKTMFHPTQPYLVIMTKKHVFVYSLKKQQLIKKLLSGNQWNSSLDIHPYGDNILLGSYDRTVCWFDLDMGSVPYKKMKYHEEAVQKVCFHKQYPLFASCSEDRTINIFHGGVSVNDFSQSALIVPLKLLKSKQVVKDIVFHPTQPWIFSISNENVYLWT